jgi:type VI secretion system protein ImpA
MEFDFDKLVEPIPGDNPAGENLREDFSHDAVFITVKSARNEARAAERRRIARDPDAPTPDWSPILRLVPEAIQTKSKDLELACWLTEALIREYGFAGLRDGFKLLRCLVEQPYWDRLYPLADPDKEDQEEAIADRIAPFEDLNGRDRDGTLIAPINNVPLTEETAEYPAYPLWRYRQEGNLAKVTDSNERQRMIDAGMPTREMLDAAEEASSDRFCQETLQHLNECLEEFDQLVKLLDQKCGTTEAGLPLGPSSSRIRSALADCQEIVAATAQRKGLAGGGGGGDADDDADDGDDGDDAEVSDGGDGVAPFSGQFKTRKQALDTLLKVAKFFKETEPHSPVSYALERIVKWGSLSLPDLLAELIEDGTSRTDVFRLVGIRESDSNE